ncbi:MAG: hypothetical protein F4221_00965 [Rhodothermaceae bacterium]|nr:hypothetical protein [Rhodothermaceae bacterium]
MITAILCVNSILYLDAVLREIVAGPRDLIGARYGMITTIDYAGQPQDFVSCGRSSSSRFRFRLLNQFGRLHYAFALRLFFRYKCNQHRR